MPVSFRSPSVPPDDQGNYPLAEFLDDLCSDFSKVDRKAIADSYMSVSQVSPQDRVKHLLVAVIGVHHKYSTASPHVKGIWEAQVHEAIGEFCRIMEPALTPTPQHAPTPSPVGVTPQDHPEDVDMAIAEAAGLSPPPPLVPSRHASATPPPTAPVARAKTPAPAPALAQAKGKGKAKAPSTPQPPSVSYTAAAAKPKPAATPARPSLVISLNQTSDAERKTLTAKWPAFSLARICNEALSAVPEFANVRVSAARWTPKGNIVAFAGPDTSLAQLLTASHILTAAITTQVPTASPTPISARANVRWSKVLINGVPLGLTASGPHSSKACHVSLITDNPSYSTLKVTQLPSWVRKPSSYLPPADKLSLVVGFEDPDGTIAVQLLKDRHLFIFGVQATVKKWKHKSPPPADRAARLAAKATAAAVRAGMQPSGPSHVEPSPAPPAVASTSHRHPTPGPSAAPLIHSPPTAPVGCQSKKAKKKAGAISAPVIKDSS